MFIGWSGGACLAVLHTSLKADKHNTSFKRGYKGNTQIKRGNTSNPLGAGLNLNRTLGIACYMRMQVFPHQDSPLWPKPIMSCASMQDSSPKAVQASGTLLAGGDRAKPLTADLSCFILVPLPLSLIKAVSILGL